MNPMIEYTIESRRFLPFIGCKSGPSEWLEDLSRATSLLKSIQSLEGVMHLFEECQIYVLVYPVQSLISDRFFEEIYRKKEDFRPEKFQFREKNENVSSEINLIDLLSTKKKSKADLEIPAQHGVNRKMDTAHGLKDGSPQAGLNIDLSEFEKKIPVELRTREELLRNIINRYGEEIKDIHVGQGLNTLKQVLKYPGSNSIEKLKRTEKNHTHSQTNNNGSSDQTEQNFFSITGEHSSGKNFKNVLSERISEQLPRCIENISVSKKSLEEKSDKIIELNQNGVTSFADHHTHDFLDPNKQLIENKEFNMVSERISEQFSRCIQGISASKKLLDEKSENTDGQDRHFFTEHTEYNTKNIKPESNHVLSERISEQFDRILIPDLRIPENKRKLDIVSQTDSNMLIEQAYSNYESKTNVKEDNRENFKNFIDKIEQVINQNNRNTALSKQNIFNIHVSGDIPASEKDIQSLSDKLVLILKEQARRHGIDLS